MVSDVCGEYIDVELTGDILLEPLNLRRRRVHMQRPKVTDNLDLPLQSEVSKVLIPEYQHLALRSVQRKLIQSFLA